jgi:hypothetical protein
MMRTTRAVADRQATKNLPVTAVTAVTTTNPPRLFACLR